MPAQTHSRRYWVSYDIADDLRRGRIYRLLTGYGMWVQYSAFECVLDANELRSMLRQLDKLVDHDDDQIAVYQCAAAGQPGHPLLAQGRDRRHDYWLR